MDFVSECSARAIGFKKVKKGSCPGKKELTADQPRVDTMFKMEAYWGSIVYVRHTQKTSDGINYYLVSKEKCRCSVEESRKTPVHIYSTFGHCVDYPNPCIAECAGHKIHHQGECVKLNRNITEICPCSDNIINVIHHKNKEGNCVEFKNECFAECAGVTKFKSGNC
jgi:hypothetical protein